jgi:ABC-type cobalamin/Fe3+-siderophores transport system ATPase subunit
MMKAGAIICEGNPHSLVTPERLSELYGLDEVVFSHSSYYQFGMPQFRHAAV